ncbi:MAG: hypothetical protein AAFX52_05715 [Pseudomonadota bacterium]
MVDLLLKAFLGLVGIVALVGLGTWWLGNQQPSKAIQAHSTVIFVALRSSDLTSPKLLTQNHDDVLWRGKSLHALIGPEETYWTEFALLPTGTDRLDGWNNSPSIDDIYAAEVSLTPLPSFVLGLLRGLHLLGIKQRPTGALPDSMADVSARQDVMPTDVSTQKMIDLSPETEITMINFLAYKPSENGSTSEGRSTYNQYGLEAIKAVHQVGGQFLFAGRIKEVLLDSEKAPTAGAWDDLAAMIYPDPTAIFYMEQIPAYTAALNYRDEALERTVVIASERH